MDEFWMWESATSNRFWDEEEIARIVQDLVWGPTQTHCSQADTAPTEPINRQVEARRLVIVRRGAPHCNPNGGPLTVI